MANPNLHFKVGSRKAFDEESPVLDAARDAASDVAGKRGQHQGRALFKVTSRAGATPTVHPQAVDIVRKAVARPISEESATAVGRGEGVVTVPPAQVQAFARLFSNISSADPAMVESLRRIGIHLQRS